MKVLDRKCRNCAGPIELPKDRHRNRAQFCSVRCSRLFHQSGNNPAPVNDSERFWARITRGQSQDCWEWTGGRSPQGYGIFYLAGKRCHAHRVAWLFENGAIPDGLSVLHDCDNPPCCNPQHLFLGTLDDNNKDRDRKGRGRHPKGEEHPRAKITREQVGAIRELVARNPCINIAQLGREHGLSRSGIHHIVRGESWKDA